MKKNSIIFATAGQFQLSGIKIAKKMGMKIISIDHSSKAEGLKYSDLKIISSLDDFTYIIKKIDAYKYKPIGVVSYCSEAGMFLSAQLREYYNLTGPNIKITKLLINKLLQRKRLFNKFYVPNFYSSSVKKKLCEYIKNKKKPLIIKPIDSSGSRGVIKISDNLSVESKVLKSLSFSKQKKIIVEDYIDGKELTVEIFLVNSHPINLAITEKKKLKKTHGTVAYQLDTTNLQEEKKLAIFKYVEKAYQRLGYNNGYCHAEIIIKNNKFYIIELAGRGAGFDVFDKFIPKISNINIGKLLIEQSVGKINTLIKLKNNHGSIKYYPSKKGTISKIIYKKFNDKNVYFKKFVNIGDNTNNADSDGDRNGYILVIDKKINVIKKKISYYYKNLIFMYN